MSRKRGSALLLITTRNKLWLRSAQTDDSATSGRTTKRLSAWLKARTFAPPVGAGKSRVANLAPTTERKRMMNEQMTIRSIQRWEYEGGRLLHPKSARSRQCLTSIRSPIPAGDREARLINAGAWPTPDADVGTHSQLRSRVH